MARGARWVAALFVALSSVVACGDADVASQSGDETTTGMPPETPMNPSTSGVLTTGVSETDGQESGSSGMDTDDTGGGQGDPCTSSEDCDGWCYDPDGDGMGECVEPCGPECPRGYECELVEIDDMVVEACVQVPDTFCDSCRTNEDCGGWLDLCVQFNGGNFCTIDCAGDPDICPPGFGCGRVSSVGDGKAVLQCVPNNGICCIDADGDVYGDGDGCYDVDCDDENAAVHTQADEVCDGFDNDCNGVVDDEVSDCAPATCELGALGYYENPAEQCVDGECVGDPASLCDLYTCSEGGEEGDECADACDGEDDTKCVPPAHCDANVCEPDDPDGTECDEDSDCVSNHCQNGFCCQNGDCCAQVEDCPTFGTQDPICISPATCQGTAGAALCGGNFICSNTGIVEDDSACDSSTEASDCGPYPSVFCTGDVDQIAPECADSCEDDGDCDPDAHCNPVTMACEPDVNDGNACMADSWCISAHCQNGFCCQNGDCCSNEDDCPASYSSDPECTSPATCQGERDVATCNANMCGTSMGVADDTACVAGTVASTCGPYPNATCPGGSVQNPPECADSCTSDTECDANAYCSAASVCVPDEPDGDTCTADSQCVSGHCQNGFCCASGDCCANDGDCNAYDEPSECDSIATCQGSRVEGDCNASSQCVAVDVNDDSGCAGAVANDCGPYPSVVCGAGMNQSAPSCGNSCTGDSDCDLSAHCDGGVCVPDAGPGGFCTNSAQCAGGLSCVDNVCCSSSCTSTCMACDVPGSEGTCTAIPAGSDFDNECGAIDCAGYYHSWSGDNCRERADVSAASAACDGAGACQTAASRCPSQGVGPVVETCHADCESPAAGTCTGQTAPVCNAVNPGTQTCGLGICQTTVNQCQNGAPLQCVPDDDDVPEVCNNLDDDCDGTIDDGDFSDDYEPNGSCAAVRTLNQVGSWASVTYNTQTIYAQGDNDYYFIRVEETDSECQWCSIFGAEEYRVWIDLTVPSGAGSYNFCTNTSCGSVNTNCQEVLAGQTRTWIWTFGGQCAVDDGYNVYLRIYGDNAPAFECLPYTLTYSMEPGCYDD